MKQLQLKGVEFKWTIVGDGPQEEELKYHLHALRLQPYVELAGKKSRNEILAYYQQHPYFFYRAFMKA